MMAFAGTGAIFLGMATLSTVIKRDLSSMGKFLFIGAIMVLVAGIANIFLQSSALMITLSVLVIGIFSAFIVYDLKRVQDGLETNYITATLGVYLSLYNVFPSLLSIFGTSAAAANRRFATGASLNQQGPVRGLVLFQVQARSKTAMLSTCVGVREHVDRAGRRAAVAGAMHQQPGVARQRRRVAADVDDPLRRPSQPAPRRLGGRSASALAIANAPSRGGSTSQRSAGPIAARSSGVDLEQVARREARLARRGRCSAAASRARCDQRRAALDAEHRRAPASPAAA